MLFLILLVYQRMNLILRRNLHQLYELRPHILLLIFIWKEHHQNLLQLMDQL